MHAKGDPVDHSRDETPPFEPTDSVGPGTASSDDHMEIVESNSGYGYDSSL